jgi:hypothetical protein
MTKWARRVIEIKYADPSFNFRDNQLLIDFLNNESNMDFDIQSNSGMVDIPVKVLVKAIRKSVDLRLDEKTIALINNDIKVAIENKEETVLYDFF